MNIREALEDKDTSQNNFLPVETKVEMYNAYVMNCFEYFPFNPTVLP